MAIRTVIFTAASTGITPTAPQDAGVAGEHNATKVVFNLDPLLISTDYRYRIEYVDGENQFDTTDNSTLASGQTSISTDIPNGWTSAGGIAEIRLVISKLDTDGTTLMDFYSQSGRLSYSSQSSGADGETELKYGLSALIENAETATTNATSAAYATNTTNTAVTSAESTRSAAESNRQTMENSRINAEQNRAMAENSRTASESGRVSAENSRVTAENGRTSAESSRSTAESSRVTAENKRVDAENSRATTESGRVTAESTRTNAESNRVTAESNRVTSENNRVTAENNRVTAEQGRVEAETARQTGYSGFDTRITGTEAFARYSEQKLKNIGGSLPTFSTVPALQADAAANTADGRKNTYLVTADGKWYYWNGTAWTGGGQYQSTGLSDGSVSNKKISDFSCTELAICKNAAMLCQAANYIHTYIMGTAFTSAYDIIGVTINQMIQDANPIVIYILAYDSPTGKYTLYSKANLGIIAAGVHTIDVNLSVPHDKTFYVGFSGNLAYGAGTSYSYAYIQSTMPYVSIGSQVSISDFSGTASFDFGLTNINGSIGGMLSDISNHKSRIAVLEKDPCRRWAGKKIYLMGDSISSDDYTWYKSFLEAKTGASVYNAGFSGYNAAYIASNTSFTRLTGYAPDLVICLVGGNDDGSSGTVGTFDANSDNGKLGEPIAAESNISTDYYISGDYWTASSYQTPYFIGALSHIIRKFNALYYDFKTNAGISGGVGITSDQMKTLEAQKKPRFVLLTTLPQKRSYGTFSNQTNWQRKRNACLEAAEKYNVPCLDIFKLCRWDWAKEPIWTPPTDKITSNGIYTMDGLHPNEFGYDYLTNILSEFIKGI